MEVLNWFSDSKAFAFLVSSEGVELDFSFSTGLSSMVAFLSSTVFTMVGSFVVTVLEDPKLTNGLWDSWAGFTGEVWEKVLVRADAG